MVLPGLHIVARLDGRGFTRLTKEIAQFEKPFDVAFRDYMIQTTEHLMNCGFRVVYAFIQSDEISLLFHRDETSFSRKLRKFNLILSGEASAKFSLLFGDVAVFDCRVSQLPNAELVRDYFRWRQEDAHRNALNAHCYWLLRAQGYNMNVATQRLSGMSIAAKNELLFEHGINFNELPNWQKRGVGLYWETYQKEGTNLKTGEKVSAERQRIKCKLELPLRDEYDRFIFDLLA